MTPLNLMNVEGENRNKHSSTFAVRPANGLGYLCFFGGVDINFLFAEGLRSQPWWVTTQQKQVSQYQHQTQELRQQFH